MDVNVAGRLDEAEVVVGVEHAGRLTERTERGGDREAAADAEVIRDDGPPAVGGEVAREGNRRGVQREDDVRRLADDDAGQRLADRALVEPAEQEHIGVAAGTQSTVTAGRRDQRARLACPAIERLQADVDVVAGGDVERRVRAVEFDEVDRDAVAAAGNVTAEVAAEAGENAMGANDALAIGVVPGVGVAGTDEADLAGGVVDRAVELEAGIGLADGAVDQRDRRRFVVKGDVELEPVDGGVEHNGRHARGRNRGERRDVVHDEPAVGGFEADEVRRLHETEETGLATNQAFAFDPHRARAVILDVVDDDLAVGDGCGDAVLPLDDAVGVDVEVRRRGEEHALALPGQQRRGVGEDRKVRRLAAVVKKRVARTSAGGHERVALHHDESGKCDVLVFPRALRRNDAARHGCRVEGQLLVVRLSDHVDAARARDARALRVDKTGPVDGNSSFDIGLCNGPGKGTGSDSTGFGVGGRGNLRPRCGGLELNRVAGQAGVFQNIDDAVVVDVSAVGRVAVAIVGSGACTSKGAGVRAGVGHRIVQHT